MRSRRSSHPLLRAHASRIAGALLSTVIACDCSQPSEDPETHASDQSAKVDPRNARWNVLFILSDALRAASLPMYGYPRDTSPNLAAMAKESVIFDRHYSAASYTFKSVSQMFTGLLRAPALMATQHTRGIQYNLPNDLGILPKLLHDAGYRTTLVTAHPWFNKAARVHAYFDQHALFRKRKRAYVEFEKLLPAAMKTLRKSARRKKPFFLYVHAMDTHHPYHMHKGFDDHVGDGKANGRYNHYDSEIRYTDAQVGKLLAKLDKLGLADNTLVVFTADHGEEFREMGGGWHNKTHGSNARRAATHIPLIMRLPKAVRRTGRFEDFTSHLDVTPTVARLAAPSIDLTPYEFDGDDLSDRVLKGAFGLTDRPVFASSGDEFVMRRGDAERIDFVFNDWTQDVRLYAHSPDASNYPRPKQIEPEAKYAPVIEFFKHVVDNRSQMFRSLPKRKRKPKSGDTFPPLAPELNKRLPSKADMVDDRWGLREGRHLIAQPSEKPGSITLSEGIVAGRYRVDVKLLRKPKMGNGFRLAIDGMQGDPIVFPPDRARKEHTLPAGTHDLPDHFQVTIDEPREGVAIAGFTLKYLGEGETEPAETVDPELTQQLRALGYVE